MNLWFVVPAHGRFELAKACLAGLAWTVEQLPFTAEAVVVADDDNLDTAHGLGFWTHRQENQPLGRKLNDGIQVAVRNGATHVAPLGTDDLLHPGWLQDLPEDRILGRYHTTLVNETGTEAATIEATGYAGASGCRVVPVSMLKPLRYRPAHEDARRGLDGSVNSRIYRNHRRRPGTPDVHSLFRYRENHPYEFVDFKTPGAQLNPYRACVTHRDPIVTDPWAVLAEHYPAEILDPIHRVYKEAA